MAHQEDLRWATSASPRVGIAAASALRADAMSETAIIPIGFSDALAGLRDRLARSLTPDRRVPVDDDFLPANGG
ncbi:MAG: hypothetical protein AAFZ09_17860 [Pseudomonadota bacterium]